MKERSVTADITDALFELLKTKELSQITVTELIKKAGVCRASFYRHFYLTEDVIRQYGTTMYEEINQNIPLCPTGIYEHILAVNTYLFSKRERLGLIEQRGLYHLWEGPITQQCVYQLQRLDVWSNYYQAEFYAGAVTRLLRVWARNNFAESPDEISRIIYTLLNYEPLKLDFFSPEMRHATHKRTILSGMERLCLFNYNRITKKSVHLQDGLDLSE